MEWAPDCSELPGFSYGATSPMMGSPVSWPHLIPGTSPKPISKHHHVNWRFHFHHLDSGEPFIPQQGAPGGFLAATVKAFLLGGFCCLFCFVFFQVGNLVFLCHVAVKIMMLQLCPHPVSVLSYLARRVLVQLKEKSSDGETNLDSPGRLHVITSFLPRGRHEWWWWGGGGECHMASWRLTLKMEEGAISQECRWPLEARKGKEMDSRLRFLWPARWLSC